MTSVSDVSPPRVKLTRAQWIRLAVVGFFVTFVLIRVVPDVVRIVQPLGIFDYVTDGNGVVVRAPVRPPKGTDRLLVGDRVRIDRIKPFDRKPGLARIGFTRGNVDRYLPIERLGKLRIVHLKAQPEPLASRIITVVRILIFITSVGFGAILVLVKPNVATWGFFVFCLGGDYSTTFADVYLDVPWREIPQWAGDMLRGAARPSLLLFALCLLIDSPKWQRIAAMVIAAVAVMLGTLDAYRVWLLTYAGTPVAHLDHVFTQTSSALTAATTVAFLIALVRARSVNRQRIGWIVFSFAVAGVARLLSDKLFPSHITFWENGLLLTLTVVPIIVVWIAVVRHHIFDVDFVVSRAIVYTAITVAALVVIGLSEELITYVFYSYSDLAQVVNSTLCLVIGSLLGRITHFLNAMVDRFVFRDRRAQRKALERIATDILDASTVDEVYRALFIDACAALNLAFGGILVRTQDGSFELAYRQNWPEDYQVRLGPNDRLTREITKSRSSLTFEDKRTARLIRRSFPNERLTFAAPLFSERMVSGIVVYGNNVSGLDLDPEERAQLGRVVAHASIALNAIELARYRAGAFELMPRPS